MREIKFRAWYPAGRTMLSGIANRCMIDFEGRLLVVDNISGSYIHPHESVLLQFTGLKDKNGNEIYEGDVLKWTHPDFRENKIEHKILEMNDIRKSLMLEPDCAKGWIEVVGNIWENPDLLAASPAVAEEPESL